MKTIVRILVVGMSFAIAPVASANNEQGHGSMHSGHHDTAGKEVTLTGELIGLTCYLKHGSAGQGHKSCAKDCAKKGLPIGLLVDGKIFEISGDGHQTLIEAYKPLLKYLESKVVVKGKVFEKSGMKILVIKKIKNA